LLTVPLFFLSGPGYVALRVVPVLLSVVAALLVWRVGRRTIGDPAGGVAAALLWLWFPENLVHLTHQYDFYASDIVYCALILLLCLRVVERPDRLRVGLLGLTLGLAFWQTVQIVPVALPAIIWTAWKQPRSLRHAWIAAVLAVVGALPWIVWNLRHDWGSLMVRATRHEYVHSLRIFVSPLLPMTLGLRTPLTGQLLVPSKILVSLAYLVVVLLFVYAAVRARRANRSLLYAVAAAFPLIWALSRRVSFLTATPRFLIVLTPVLAVLAAQGGRRIGAALALAAAAFAISVVSLNRMNADASAFHPRGLPVTPRNLGPLVAGLGRLQLDHVYADYWIAYRLDFDSHEHIVASEIDPVHGSLGPGGLVVAGTKPRYPPYAWAVQAHRHGFVFFRRSLGPRPIAAQLRARGYRRVLIGPYVIFAPP
jgi:4-amino-4-deoxy-L-arabinose transferase-like glycosyltransferase